MIRRSKKHTLIWFTDTVLFYRLFSLSRILNHKRNVLPTIHTHIAITDQVHNELILTRLWRRLELHLESLHIERWRPFGCKEGFVECCERERGDRHLSGFGIRQEDVPVRWMIPRKIWRVGERRLKRLVDFFRGCNCRRRIGGSRIELLGFLTAFFAFATKKCIKIPFVRVDILKVVFIDCWYVGCTWRDDPRFDDQLDKGAGYDVPFAHDFEERFFDFQ